MNDTSQNYSEHSNTNQQTDGNSNIGNDNTTDTSSNSSLFSPKPKGLVAVSSGTPMPRIKPAPDTLTQETAMDNSERSNRMLKIHARTLGRYDT